jgi:hypothetical protein
MAVEVGSVQLEHLTHVDVSERARLAVHPVPGLGGDLVQALGRSSVAVRLEGLVFGPTATHDVKSLRDAYLGAVPVDFFADAVGEGYFAQVVIERLDIRQRAGDLDQFHYRLEVMEYVKPPAPPALDPLAAIDTDLIAEAGSFMDDVQNGISQAAGLVDLLTSVPSFADPTTKLPSMLSGYLAATDEAKQALTALRDLI